MKTILGFPNYSISRNGHIWSTPRRGSSTSGLWLQPASQKKGYLFVILYKNKKKYQRLIHRLMLETYIGFCPKGMQCRHLNGNPADNMIENLCWGTPKENQADRLIHGTSNRGVRNGQAKLCEKQVRVIFHAYHEGVASAKELAETFGVSPRAINSIIKKQTWRYLWD